MNAIIHKSIVLVIALVSATVTSVCSNRPYELAEYKCEIRILDEHKVAISALISGIGDLRRVPLDIAVLRFPSQEIADLKMTDREGKSVLPETKATLGAWLLKLSGASQESTSQAWSLNIAYIVQDPQGSIVRIPIPVPQARPPSGSSAIEIRLGLPPGAAHVRDSFPLFNWSDPARGFAAVTSIPSIVVAHWKKSSSVNVTDKLLSVATLTNLGMIMLLAAGSLIWWLTSGWAASNRSRQTAARLPSD